MVLSTLNKGRRTDTENLPPAPVTAKAASIKRNRQLTAIHNDSRRKSTHLTSKASKGRLEQAKKRKEVKKRKAKQLTFVPALATSTLNQASPAPVPRRYPRYLPQHPNFQVSEASLRPYLSEGPNGSFPTPAFVREQIEDVHGSKWIEDLSKVTPVSLPGSSLPAEVEVCISDFEWENGQPKTAIPSHMVAVWAAGSQRVTLLPVHDVVLASQCQHLPPFPSAAEPELGNPSEAPSTVTITLPVRPLCVASPRTFNILTRYLYTKSTTELLNTLLCGPAPPSLEDNQATVAWLGTFIGKKVRYEDICTRLDGVIGLWQNAMRLGVCDPGDGLWDTIDLAYEVFITALAVCVGQPDMVNDPTSMDTN